jgi:4,5-dihydroxyphthalate decarboxylase
MANLEMSLAVEHYDRHIPLLDGTVKAEGINLKAEYVPTLEGQRHERMINEQAWDAAELSLSSYIMAKARNAPIIAVPVFPRRLFSQSQMYVNTAAGIRQPTDLMGRKVGLRSYQTTLSVLAKGDLQREYGVPLDQVTWVTCSDEVVGFTPPPNVTIEQVSSPLEIEERLIAGELAAYFTPRKPEAFVAGAPEVGYLFPNSQAEEQAYYQRNGFFPIMHVVAIKADLAEREPWVAQRLFNAFEEARQVALHYYDDPNWNLFAWTPQLLQEQRQRLGPDPWVNGMAANRKNLERFVQYEVDQGLIPATISVDDLFAANWTDGN